MKNNWKKINENIKMKMVVISGRSDRRFYSLLYTSRRSFAVPSRGTAAAHQNRCASKPLEKSYATTFSQFLPVSKICPVVRLCHFSLTGEIRHCGNLGTRKVKVFLKWFLRRAGR